MIFDETRGHGVGRVFFASNATRSESVTSRRSSGLSRLKYWRGAAFNRQRSATVDMLYALQRTNFVSGPCAMKPSDGLRSRLMRFGGSKDILRGARRQYPVITVKKSPVRQSRCILFSASRMGMIISVATPPLQNRVGLNRKGDKAGAPFFGSAADELATYRSGHDTMGCRLWLTRFYTPPHDE
jgi:hypothetical protein